MKYLHEIIMKNLVRVRIIRALAYSTAIKYILGYSTRNHKFKRLEPHFQISATRSGWEEGTETAVALPH